MDSHQNHSPVWNTLLIVTAGLGLVTAFLVYHSASIWPEQFAKESHHAEKHGEEKHDKSGAHSTEVIHESEVAEKKEATKEQREIKEPEKVIESKYYLIVGSFEREENAEGLKETLGSKGYPVEILPSNGKYRVSIFSHPRYSEILKEQSARSEFEASWVVKK